VVSSARWALLAQGLDLKVIQEILGHSTITITGNLYAQVLMGLKREAAAQMDSALGVANEADGSAPDAVAALPRVAARGEGTGAARISKV
jgi:hypothetical protein